MRHPVSRLVRGACLAALALAAAPAGADVPADNGVFRFLTQSLPIGSTNAEYVARLITANADGTVTYSVAPGSALAPGMTLDARTGYVTGRPTATYNQNITLGASDGTNQIQLTVNLKVNAAGGGGNEGSTFTNVVLAEGRVGVAYEHTVGLANGVGPFVFGAAALPPGLTLDGATGRISGTPTAPGTYFVNLSVTDHGENVNKVVTVQPLTVLPAAGDFRFTSQIANNGEVGTPFLDTWTTSGAAGTLTYTASGLPPGLSVDGATGQVTGTPTVAGTFTVVAGARDGVDTLTMNVSMIVVPSATSALHWDFAGLPCALAGVAYTRQPPILVAAKNGTTLTYAVAGLPAGITYDPSTGELAGMTTEIGEHPVTFTATDTTAGATIQLPIDFLVLPPGGGDANSLSVNLWISKESIRAGRPGRDTWNGAAIFNADRRTGFAFDPAVDPVLLEAGSCSLQLPAGSLKGTPKSYSYVSVRGATPAERVRISVAKQTLQWATSRDTITETLPVLARHTIIARRGFRMDAEFDAAGRLKAPFAFARPAFVVASGKAAVLGAGKDTLTLSFLLADPSFGFEAGVSPLRVRVLDGATPILDRTFGELATDRVSTELRTGRTLHKIGITKDPATSDRVARFSLLTKSGKGALALTGMTLPALDTAQEHLGIELTVGTRTYFTSVTFFAPVAGRYTTTMP